MRFLTDQDVCQAAISWLQLEGHDVRFCAEGAGNSILHGNGQFRRGAKCD